MTGMPEHSESMSPVLAPLPTQRMTLKRQRWATGALMGGRLLGAGAAYGEKDA